MSEGETRGSDDCVPASTTGRVMTANQGGGATSTYPCMCSVCAFLIHTTSNTIIIINNI